MKDSKNSCFTDCCIALLVTAMAFFLFPHGIDLAETVLRNFYDQAHEINSAAAWYAVQ